MLAIANLFKKTVPPFLRPPSHFIIPTPILLIFLPPPNDYPHVVLKVDSTTEGCPGVQWIEQCHLKPPQQLHEYFVQFDHCNRLTQTYVLTIPEDQFIISLHLSDMLEGWFVASRRGQDPALRAEGLGIVSEEGGGVVNALSAVAKTR